ncbi:YSIRK-type signal peptide-containing protein [Streptococcus dysgalactiae]|uniref:YSIRK-type signal peptide-containing protein n=1 Tax=Streptococcus dysgalactiae TaxID=1334 RepID=UPI0022852D47|nr:YSIRK-type signal peptide-containing protein [Streptococcus dysgalactiae]MCY7229334.1 YSIRK-type signal peptide-containing protein [Streptococcus dysgalactiae]
MARENTNKHYSLRKLKTGTASVAVALTVVGAGLASQTEVKAAEHPRYVAARGEVLDNIYVPGRLWAYQNEEIDKLKLLLGESNFNKYDLEDRLKDLSDKNQKIQEELENKKKDYQLAVDGHANTVKRYKAEIAKLDEIIKKQSETIEKEVADYNSLFDKMKVVNDSYQNTKREYDLIEEELGKKLKENQDLEEKLKDKEFYLGETLRYINELDLKLGQLNIDNIDLKHELEQEKQKAEADRQTLEAEKAKLEEEKQISDASRQSLRRDLDASREAKKQLEAEYQKLEEEKQISDASRQSLRRDLDASREAKKQLEAEYQKLEEQNKISEASRKGLRRDLDASREAKKQVEKALEEANSKLAALEKLNKELEESKKLTEKEKAELQAKLEAEAKALKEKLAKQAEELAKLRAGKASDSQTPEATPGNKVVPGKGQAPQAGTKPNQNKEPMKETKRQLPSTGEATNPFFTAAALAVMATAGVAAVAKRKEEN